MPELQYPVFRPMHPSLTLIYKSFSCCIDLYNFPGLFFLSFNNAFS